MAPQGLAVQGEQSQTSVLVGCLAVLVVTDSASGREVVALDDAAISAAHLEASSTFNDDVISRVFIIAHLKGYEGSD
tara:strand:- start:399 stop:629 length:231 start_codon:yes stop_codon:yes gene_type:complete